MNIQLFMPKYRTEECLEGIKECFDKGWTGLGYKTTEFEDKWKEYTGLKNAHFINSATVGLHLAVKILKEKYGWNNDSEIISTPLTFVSTNHAILYENLKVVFADINEYLCLCPVSVEARITKDTKAILYVGIGGNSGSYNEIVKICKKYNLKLILDAAHMAGTRINGEIPGIEADVVVYSFQAVKNLPTADSGMICFKEKEDDELCRKLSWLGINKDTFARSNINGTYKWKYDVEQVGYKYHGNSIMAAIGIVQLKYIDEDNRYRRKLASLYDELLSQHSNLVKVIPTAPDCESSRHLYIIEIDHRDEVLNQLNKSGIYPGVHYRDNTEYRMYSYADGTCPNSKDKSERIISLPLHLYMSKEDVEYVAKELIRILFELESI